MIDIFQGTPGSGKSACAVALLLEHIRKGGVVAANFSLTDGWCDVLARKLLFSYFDDQYRFNKSSSYFERFFMVDSVSAIESINPKRLAVDIFEYKGGYTEGEGLLILDEAQLCFNSRSWDKNMKWIKFFTQHRKRGWNVILIAHTIDMIDSQIRPLCEYESRFRNMQKIKLPLIDIPLSPVPMFLMIQRYAGISAGSGEISKKQVIPLPKWAASLYDSLTVFDFNSWDKETEPLLCGRPPEPVKDSLPVPRPQRVKSSLAFPVWDDNFQS